MLPNPERRLRKLIVELAELSPDDGMAILAELSQAERERVEMLLQEYAGTGTPPAREMAAVEGLDLSNISPWLRERLENPAAAGVTPHVAKTLRATIEQLQPLASNQSSTVTSETARPSRLFAKGRTT